MYLPLRSADALSSILRMQGYVSGFGFEEARRRVLGEGVALLGADSGFAAVRDAGGVFRVAAGSGRCAVDAVLSEELVSAAGVSAVNIDGFAPPLFRGEAGSSGRGVLVKRGKGGAVFGFSKGGGFTGEEALLFEVVCGFLDDPLSGPGFEAAVNRRMWEEVGRLSSELAHDLRSPLQTITNSLFLLERKPQDREVYLGKINGALVYSTRLLDGFREYYRGHELSLMKGNVNRVAEKALQELEAPPAVRVAVRLDEGVPDTVIDSAKLRRVFWQIAKNGVEAMPEGGTLALESRLAEPWIEVRVSDTGAGIREGVKEKVMLPFGAKKRGGMGLGLAASKRVVEAHGGSLTFASEEGRGTVFTVLLPV